MAAISINAPKVLADLNINPKSSVHIAVQNVGERIAASPNPLNTANIIIAKLGVSPVNHVAEARVLAKCLVEQAIILQEKYIVASAEVRARAKVEKMKIDLPYLFMDSTSNTTQVGEGAEGEDASHKGRGNGDKLNQALEIFRKFQDKPVADCVAAMMKGIRGENGGGITYANAYYYYRKFKKGG